MPGVCSVCQIPLLNHPYCHLCGASANGNHITKLTDKVLDKPVCKVCYEWSLTQTKEGVIEHNMYWSELQAKRDGLE